MIKKQAVKTILLLTILVFGLFLTFNFARAQEATPEGRALEIVYPQIPGVATPKVISTGLPEYIEYIFRFSIWLIGFVILGALIYAGFQYFTSFGNPEKFSAAKSGIISAFLGGIILLGAVLIFNTINPQLVILEAPPLDILAPTVMPGIYLCNYKPDNVRGAIESYLYGTKEEKIEAAKELKKIMQDGKNTCFKVSRSWNLDFEFDQKLHDIFVIPRIEYVYDPENPSEPRTTPINDFGLIFHQKDNFLGKYFLAVIYPEDIATYPNFSARSVTLFQKPDKEPESTNLGVILYQCINYDGPDSFCPEGVTSPSEATRSFGGPASQKPMYNDYKVTVAPADLDSGLVPSTIEGRETITVGPSGPGGGGASVSVPIDLPGTTGVRSIKIDPEGSYFAILFDGKHFGNDSTFAEIIKNSDNNLLDQPIGHCPAKSCNRIIGPQKSPDNSMLIKACGPCLKSMIVVKGKVIK